MMSLQEELQAIYDREGQLTPALVVAEAATRGEDDPLHKHVFNVPADEAADRYFLDRAARLIRRVRIAYVASTGAAPTTRVVKSVSRFTGVPDARTAPGLNYKPTTEVVQNQDDLASVYRRLDRELASIKKRYSHLQDFALHVQEHLLAG